MWFIHLHYIETSLCFYISDMNNVFLYFFFFSRTLKECWKVSACYLCLQECRV